jgi:hypothetical protein
LSEILSPFAQQASQFSEEPISMSEGCIRSVVIHALAATLLTGGISVGQIAQPSSVPTYLDSSQPVSVRVDDLVSKMTLEEKASQLVNQARAIPRLQVPAYDWWLVHPEQVALTPPSSMKDFSMRMDGLSDARRVGYLPNRSCGLDESALDRWRTGAR